MRKPALKPVLKVGGERKKAMLLGGLLVVAAIVYFINKSDAPKNAPSSSAAPGRVDSAIPPAGPGARTMPRPGSRSAGRSNLGQGRGVSSNQEFRPTLKPKDPIDPSRVDPTLKLGLLAKLKTVSYSGGGRSLFDFAGAPAPKVEIAKVKPILPGAMRAGVIGPIDVKPPPPAVPPPPPPPPPIPLKFYGFTNPAKQVGKRAFFLEGEDIFVAAEGDLIKNRYKVVRIGVNSAVVEDTSNKHQQTLPLEAEQVAS